MSPPKSGQKLVAIAIDKDKGSQAAMKWAIDTICNKGQRILLIHVKLRPPGAHPAPAPRLNEISEQCNAFDELDPQTRELLLPFRILCSRKDISTQEIVLEDVDISKALIGFVKMSAIEVLVLGAAAKGLFRLKVKDIPGTVLKGVPDFCSVYIISKGKISTTRTAARQAPPVNSFRSRILHQSSTKSNASYDSFSSAISRGSPRGTPPARHGDSTSMKSPFTHRRGANGKLHEYSPAPESDITFVSSGRPSVQSFYPSFSGNFEDPNQQISGFSELDSKAFASMNLAHRSVNAMPRSEISSYASFMSQNMGDDDEEMQRLRQELKQTMEMYNSACKEVLTAKQKAFELEEKRQSEESAHILVEQEKAKSKAAIENAEPARRISELESQKRVYSGRKTPKEVKEKFSTSGLLYRRYTIEEIEDATDYFSQSRKIGEGSYGPIYKCYLEHTPVAVKVLPPDAAQGRSKFQKEVEILSRIRHPNMVLLLGACPDYGCLVYEYMFHGSLEDRLMQRGKSPPLSWQHRFRIAAEITTGLLFLHKTTPEPIVHRDLNPQNILLDKNLVSKINDVGLARLVPPSVAETVTLNRMSSTAGAFCYIDPEYQQTGLLGVKSDIYSLGLIFLQMLTSRSPMGLAHQIRRAIESGALAQMLDPTVPDWPIEDALCLAKLALQCCELRSEDRPDLGEVVMPELERLRALSEETKFSSSRYSSATSLNHRRVSKSQGEFNYSIQGQSGRDYSRSMIY